MLVIIAATGIMGALCYYVYKIEHQTTQFTNNGPRHLMVLFKQSCWFVFAFYVTWIPYLALQVCKIDPNLILLFESRSFRSRFNALFMM